MGWSSVSVIFVSVGDLTLILINRSTCSWVLIVSVGLCLAEFLFFTSKVTSIVFWSALPLPGYSYMSVLLSIDIHNYLLTHSVLAAFTKYYKKFKCNLWRLLKLFHHYTRYWNSSQKNSFFCENQACWDFLFVHLAKKTINFLFFRKSHKR